MLREFFLSQDPRESAWAWAGLVAILAHGLFRAWLKYLLNGWYSRFYDLGGSASEVGSGDFQGLEEGARDVASLLWEFALICLPQVLLHPLFKLFSNLWVLKWRVALVNSYLARWRVDGGSIENGAQRVHEDTQRFARGLQTCFVVVLDAVLTLFVFAPLLLRMGGSIQPFDLPGAWLLSACALVSLVGISGSVLFGWSLVGLEVANQKVEAELRKKLVLLEERPTDARHADESSAFTEIAIDESVPPSAFSKVIRDLKANYVRLYKRFALFSLWLGSYEQTVTILPYAVTAPLLFCSDPARRISLGRVTQVSNAFSNVFSSLNILADNWVEVTDWLSVLRRLREWETHIAVFGHSSTRKLVSVGVPSSSAEVELQNP